MANFSTKERLLDQVNYADISDLKQEVFMQKGRLHDDKSRHVGGVFVKAEVLEGLLAAWELQDEASA